MATLVCFHAHPDDESIATAGVMAKAARDGHKVVLVVATKGEVGEVPDGYLDAGETLADRRVRETIESARIIGVARNEWLGYKDSGMMSEPTNDDPACFWRADVEEAAGRLADILREVGCDVLTIYDEEGGYGHPDHIQVHRVGVRAAELVGVPRVYESTMNRDYLLRLMQNAVGEGLFDRDDVPDVSGLGVTEDKVTTGVDVREFAHIKRASMQAHASQIDEQSFFLQLPIEAFRETFGMEWFIRRDLPSGTGPVEVDLFAGLDA